MLLVTDQIVAAGLTITPDRWRELSEELKVTAVVNLRGEYQDVFGPPMPQAYLWLPVTDHTDPSIEQLLTAVQFIDRAVQSGQKVLVHCKMGIGRSPTVAAAYLVWTGLSVSDAIQKVESAAKISIVKPVVSRFVLNDFVAVRNRLNLKVSSQ